jgi:non-ribosomal peptide synthetase component F/acyl carrier protein
MALSARATLVMAPRERLLPGRELVELLASEEVTALTLPPSALAALDVWVREPEVELPRLGSLVVAGEACAVGLARRWSAGRRLVNGYGPTEATVCTTMGQYRGGERLDLGLPLPGRRVYVVSRGGELSPLGVAGELWIGGVGLAQGYVGQAERTAEVFVPDGFGGEPGGRLYRSGDLVRRRSGGELEYVGRVDRQVKVRGFRVELEEVEAALWGEAGVREAAVEVREDVAGGRGLVGWVVGEAGGGSAAAEGDLRRRLAERLPAYMVPSRLVWLGALPVGSSGKVDREALGRLPLPSGTPSGTPSGELSGEPSGRGEWEQGRERTPVEELLAGLFAAVLRREGVGVEEDFFALGGHSLLATQLASRVRQVFGVELPLAEIFQAPTVVALGPRVEELVRAVGAGGGGGVAGGPPPGAIPRAPRDGELPLSFAQQRLWFLDQLEPGGATFNVPVAVRLQGGLAVPALAAALAEVVRRHEVLRTSFPDSSGQPRQRIAAPAAVPLPRIELGGLGGAPRDAELARLASGEARRPFDLVRGPLLRATLVHLRAADTVLLLTLHHIASDGWSMGVLVRELSALYRAAAAGEPSPLAELPIQYADFAAWQQGWLLGGGTERLLAYWLPRLESAPERLDLPWARPRPARQRFRGATRIGDVGAEVGRGLEALAQQESATLFMVLLAAFQALLGIAAGVREVVVGTDVAGRNRVETEGLVGFFVNQLVLRTDLAGNPSFRELLARVREVALGAYAHQDLPFDRLVEALRLPRRLQHAPLFQAKITLQNAPEITPVELPGLRLQPLAAETTSSQLDLNLRVAAGTSGLRLSLEYDTDLFEAGAVDRLLSDFARVLAAGAARPETTLAELAADLAQAERERRERRDREIEAADRRSLRGARRRPTAARPGQGPP